MPTRSAISSLIRVRLLCRIKYECLSQSFKSAKPAAYQGMVLEHYLKCVMVPQQNMATTSKDSNIMEQALEFLETFYASQEHGILSIEAACKKFCHIYRKLHDSEKRTFLLYLAQNYGVNQDLVVQVSQQIVASQERGDAVLLRTEERMRSALIPRFQILFSQIGRIEGGVKHLVDMRADILNIQTSATSELDIAHLRTLQNSLRELLSLWFSVGFLSLERITWESPCDMVQKISEYEAVHPIRNWADLKRRVGPYRRCFVFTHSSMPREPVVVLHTALTNQISSCIHSIIGNYAYSTPSSSPVSSPSNVNKEDTIEEPATINTAMFYSITSTQKGLQGVDLGNYLIKKVVGELQQEIPNMTQFSSISPIPGFREWLIGEINRHLHTKSEERLINPLPHIDPFLTPPKEKDIGEEATDSLLTDEELSDLQYCAKDENQDPLETFKELVSSHSWSNNEHYSDIVKAPLLRLCARYLYVEKRRGYALNPVANFHLQNGAVLWRLNWMGDMTLRGLNKSCGIMVNYRYYLEYTELNSQQYIENQIINADQQIKDLIQQ